MNQSPQNSNEPLADREARLRAILNTAVEGIITIDDNGLIESMNPSAQRLFQYSEEEATGQNVALLMPSPFREEHDKYLQGYKQSGQAKIIGIGREVTGRRKDGSTFPMHLSVSEVPLSTGRIFTGFVHDLSERVAAEEKLRQLAAELEQRVEERTHELKAANEELVRKERLATLGQLAGGVAHEIRNPLGVIRNATYFLRQVTPAEDDDTRESFDEIERALSSSNHIVSELLDYARDPQPARVAFTAADVVHRALASLSIANEINVETVCPPEISLTGDLDQIQRILVNLISNAIHAMPDGGRLRIVCEQDDATVSLEVSDTGVGIPTEHADRIFDPLFSNKAKGIGLGLAISKRYAELNNGEIDVQSQPGYGATFRLTLPREIADEVNDR